MELRVLDRLRAGLCQIAVCTPCPPGGSARANWFRMVLRDDLPHLLAQPPSSGPVLSDGIERTRRTSNSSNRIEAAGFASKKEFRWPRVPLLPSFPPPNLLLSVRRRRPASR